MERRQFARIQVDLMLKFKSLEQIEDMVGGRVVDLSAGGLFIRTEHVRPVGTKVQIEMPSMEGERIFARGTVRSIRYEHNEKVGMGIEFEALSTRARAVVQYLLGRSSDRA